MSFETGFAFYYPYAGINHTRLDAIKQSLFLYEKIHFLDYGFDVTHEEENESEQEQRSRREMEVLRDAGLVEYIDPADLLEAQPDGFWDNIRQDIGLYKKKIPAAEDYYSWRISSAKIGPKVAKGLGRKRYQRTNQWEYMDWFEGEAVLLNHAYFACSSQKLVPFTNEDIHFKAFSLKIGRHIRNLENKQNIKDILVSEGIIDNAASHFLGCYSLETQVPIFSYPKSISASQFVRFHKETENQRKRFREELVKIASEKITDYSLPGLRRFTIEDMTPELNDFESAIYSYEHERLKKKSDVRKAAFAAFFLWVGRELKLDLPMKVRAAAREADELKQILNLENFGLHYLIETKKRFPHIPFHS